MPQKRERNDAGLAARDVLLKTGLELFGRYGYSTVSIRQICQLAKMNVASINYHFGGKADLYLAIADAILDKLNAQMAPAIQSARLFLENQNSDKSLALEHILNMVDAMADVLIPDSKERELWALFITRFQLGDEAPEHELSHPPMAILITDLISMIRNSNEDRFNNAVCAQTIIGQILVFRVSRASARHALGIESFGENETEQIKAILRANVLTLFSHETRK